jgi:hypothetical protein
LGQARVAADSRLSAFDKSVFDTAINEANAEADRYFRSEGF